MRVRRIKSTRTRWRGLRWRARPSWRSATCWSGPTALATSIDPVAAAKIAVEFAKTTDKFEIIGGAIGRQMLDLNGVKALAELPSLDELRAKLIGTILAPATKLAQLTTAPAAKLARVFAAYGDPERDAA